MYKLFLLVFCIYITEIACADFCNPYQNIKELWRSQSVNLNETFTEMIDRMQFQHIVFDNKNVEIIMQWFQVVDTFLDGIYVMQQQNDIYFLKGSYTFDVGYMQVVEIWKKALFQSYQYYNILYLDVLSFYFVRTIFGATKCDSSSTFDVCFGNAMGLYTKMHAINERLMGTDYESLYSLQCMRYQELLQLLQYEKKR